jgi:hypothetical protein
MANSDGRSPVCIAGMKMRGSAAIESDFES